MASHLLLASLALLCAAAVPPSPPVHARDEWQPWTSTLTWPGGSQPIPTPSPAANPPTCFFLTTAYAWAGEAQNICNYPGTCTSALPTGLVANVSSAGPDPGSACALYDQAACAGEQSVLVGWPGFADLRVVGFDKRALSWRCWRLEPWN